MMTHWYEKKKGQGYNDLRPAVGMFHAAKAFNSDIDEMLAILVWSSLCYFKNKSVSTSLAHTVA